MAGRILLLLTFFAATTSGCASWRRGPEVSPPSELMRAAGRGDVVQVQELLAAGADANLASPNGSTVLMLAAFRGHEGVVAALLAAGADPLLRDRWESSALHYAAQGRGPRQADICRFLVEGGGSAELNRLNHWGLTPLMIAVQYARREVVDALLKLGSDPGAVSPEEGLTAHDLAVKRGDPEILKMVPRGPR